MSNRIEKTIHLTYELKGTRMEYPVKKFGTSAHVIVPKRLEGKTVFIIEPDE